MIDIEIRNAGPGCPGYLVALGRELGANDSFIGKAAGILIGALQSNLEAEPGVDLRVLAMEPGKGSLSWDCETMAAARRSWDMAQFVVTALAEYAACHPNALRLQYLRTPIATPEGGEDDAL